MKEEGTQSKAPLSEAFGQWKNAKVALLALLGLVAGQAVVWYTGQFYALFFLQQTLKVDGYSANLLIAWSLRHRHRRLRPVRLAVGQDRPQADHPGRLPDRGADLLPAVQDADRARQPGALPGAGERRTVTVTADPANCSFQFNPVGTAKFTNSCDILKWLLARNAVNYDGEPAPAGTIASVTDRRHDDRGLRRRARRCRRQGQAGRRSPRPSTEALAAAGYPKARDPSIVKLAHPFDIFRAQPLTVVLILTVLVIYVTMVYGPIAAALVELFPTRIRYTAMSLPYHIGNGWFGGLLPATAFAIVAQTRQHLFGALVPDLDRRRDVRHRPLVRARDQGPGHLRRGRQIADSDPPSAHREPGAGRVAAPGLRFAAHGDSALPAAVDGADGRLAIQPAEPCCRRPRAGSP